MKKFIIIWTLLLCSIAHASSLEQTIAHEDEKGLVKASGIDRNLVQVDPTLAEFNRCQDQLTLHEFIYYGPIVERLSGVVQNPHDYPKTPEGFKQFLSDSYVDHKSLFEMTIPGTPHAAQRCGLTSLLPPRGCWLRAAALGKLVDYLNHSLANKLTVSSYYRPPCYNSAIGGATQSDHLYAKSMDISLFDPGVRRSVQEHLCQSFWLDDLFNLQNLEIPSPQSLNISVGLSATFLHIGLGSQRGRRYWNYASYVRRREPPDACWPYSENDIHFYDL